MTSPYFITSKIDNTNYFPEIIIIKKNQVVNLVHHFWIDKFKGILFIINIFWTQYTQQKSKLLHQKWVILTCIHPLILYDFDFINLLGLKPLNELKKNDLFGVFNLFTQLIQWFNWELILVFHGTWRKENRYYYLLVETKLMFEMFDFKKYPFCTQIQSNNSHYMCQRGYCLGVLCEGAITIQNFNIHIFKSQ
jgi:hypothetical protein